MNNQGGVRGEILGAILSFNLVTTFISLPKGEDTKDCSDNTKNKKGMRLVGELSGQFQNRNTAPMNSLN